MKKVTGVGIAAVVSSLLLVAASASAAPAVAAPKPGKCSVDAIGADAPCGGLALGVAIALAALGARRRAR